MSWSATCSIYKTQATSSGEGISYWEFVIGKASRGVVIADDVVNFADVCSLAKDSRIA